MITKDNNNNNNNNNTSIFYDIAIILRHLMCIIFYDIFLLDLNVIYGFFVNETTFHIILF